MKKIAIHSVPRSGSTWLGSIFDSHPEVCFRFQPLFSYTFKNALTPNSSATEIQEFFEQIANSKDAFINQDEEKRSKKIPSFSKSLEPTHIVYKEVRYHHIVENVLRQREDVKIIFLIRNPLSVLSSWKNAPKEFRVHEGWVFEDEWQFAPSKNKDLPEEFHGYEKWKEATLLFLRLKEEFPDRVFLMSYTDLLQNTEDIVCQAFDFAELKFPAQTMDFLRRSRTAHDNDAYSVFKVKTHDKGYEDIPTDIQEYIINDLANTSLEKYLDL